MMRKIRFWIAGIIVIVSTVIILANFVGQPIARDERLVVKVLRSSFLEPFVIPQVLYVVKTDGTGEINEKPPHRLGDQAKWSPDGKWIVYSTLNNFWGSAETSDIYLMRSDGSFRTRLTDHETGGSFDPAWSADGTNIAYFAYDKNGNNPGIYIANVQCLLQGERCSPTPRFLVRGDSPNWSPDGEFIVYKPLYPEDGIHIIRADGTEQPTTLPLPEVKICFAPQWSPDGARIATSCYQEQSDSFEIFIVNPDGSDVFALADGSMPSWSPDGSKLAFTSRRDNLGQCIAGICGSGGVYSNAIFLVNADGSDIVRLSLRDDESVLWYAWAR
jgi:Tol biopolymer transport system component